MSDQPQYPTQPDYQQPQYQQPSPQYGAPQPPKKGGIGKWIALGGCGCLFLIAVAAGVGFFVFQMTAAPMKAVNEQLAALRDNDVQKAYDGCSSAFKQNTSLQDFQQFVDSYSFLRNAREFSSLNRKTEGGLTTLDGNVEAADGSKHPVEYRLIKESGEWRVQFIQVKEAPTPVTPAPPTDSDTEPVQEENQAPDLSETDEPSSGSVPEIFDVRVDKTAEGQSVAIAIAFQVRNFQSGREGENYSIHLVQDLETIGPDGSRINDLSQDGIKTLSESGAMEYTSANFTNSLTIPLSFPHGIYTVRLRVHDQIGGNSAEESATFELP